MKDLQESDSRYHREIVERIRVCTEEFLRKIQLSNLDCYQVCEQDLIRYSDKVQQFKLTKPVYLRDRMVEFEALDAETLKNHPLVDPLSLELSTDLMVEMLEEEADDEERRMEELLTRMSDRLKNLKNYLDDSLVKFRELASTDDKEFIQKLVTSDELFQESINARLRNIDYPLSIGLREAIVSERDTKRAHRVAHWVSEKLRAVRSICQQNDTDNIATIQKFRVETEA